MARVIAVTGAFGAAGRALVQKARGRGLQVAALDASAQAPSALEADLVLPGVNLTDEAAAARAMAAVAEKLGGLDGLANIAGGFVWQTLADGAPDAWDRMYAINVKTAATATRAALPLLLKSDAAAIVNIGANGALRASAGMGAYAAAKAGVHKLTESLAEELKGKVRVNALLPSILDTPANRADMPKADFSSWVQTDELAAAILFLLSEDASAITGALIPITGRV